VRGWLSDRVTIAQNEKKETTVLIETTWETAGRATVFAEAYEKFLRGRGVVPRVRREAAVVRVAYGADQALMESYLP
jgi:chitodextrinase